MKPSHWRLFTAAVLLVAAGIVMMAGGAWAEKAESSAEASASEAPAAESAAPAPENKKWFRGRLSTGFDGLWNSGGDEDLEFNESLQFQIDPPQYEKLHLRGSLWAIENVGAAPPGNSGLRDIDNAFDADILLRASYLYLDVDDLWKDSTLRIGRQRIMEGVAFNRIDGVYFKQRLNLWDWYAFAGTRASFYDDEFENFVGGGGFSYSPAAMTKIAVDAYYGSEDRTVEHVRTFHGPIAGIIYRLTEDDVERTVPDVSVALSVWQTVNENLSLFGRINWVDDAGSELLLSATGYVAEPWDLTYEITYRHQFNSVGDRMNDLTGYYRLLGTYESYDDVFLACHRPLTDRLTLSLETEIHDSHETDFSNRDYQRYAAVLSAENLFERAKLNGRIGLERWNVSDGEGTWAVVGEVGRKWKKIEAALGVDYQRYEDRVTVYNEPLMALDMARVWFAPGILQGYNPILFFDQHYTVQMHEDIYTVYLKSVWSINENQELQAKLTFEEDDGPDSPTWRIQADYTYRF